MMWIQFVMMTVKWHSKDIGGCLQTNKATTSECELFSKELLRASVPVVNHGDVSFNGQTM
jgi:hypothetical protein